MSDQFVWQCPSCGCRVPRKVEDCRCGFLSGQAQAAATATPVEGLNQMMSAPSQATQLRERGEQVYRKALEWAARNGEQLDSYWDRYARTCVTSAPRTGDRARTASIPACCATCDGSTRWTGLAGKGNRLSLPLHARRD